MERPVTIKIIADIEYDVGSPPDADIDPYEVMAPEVMTATWSGRSIDGAHSGVTTTSTTALYPPFQDDDRRTIFGILWFVPAVDSGVHQTVTWNAVAVNQGALWITTDPSWGTSVALANPREGYWFACEGELETERGIWPSGRGELASLE